MKVVVEDTPLSVVGQEFCEFTDRGSIPGVRGRVDDAIRKGEAWGECDLPKYFRRQVEYIALTSSGSVSSDPLYRQGHFNSLALD